MISFLSLLLHLLLAFASAHARYKAGQATERDQPQYGNGNWKHRLIELGYLNEHETHLSRTRNGLVLKEGSEVASEANFPAAIVVASQFSPMLASSPISPASQSSGSNTQAVTIAVVVTAIVSLVLAAIFFYCYRKLRPSVKVEEATRPKDDKPLLHDSSQSASLWSSVGKYKEGPQSIVTHFENPVLVIYNQPSDSILTAEKKDSDIGNMPINSSRMRVPKDSDDVATKGNSVNEVSKDSAFVATKDNPVTRAPGSMEDVGIKTKNPSLMMIPDTKCGNSLPTSLAGETTNASVLNSAHKKPTVPTLSATSPLEVVAIPLSHSVLISTPVDHLQFQVQDTPNSVVLPPMHSSAVPSASLRPPLPPSSLNAVNAMSSLGKDTTLISRPPVYPDSSSLVATETPTLPPLPPTSSNSFSPAAAQPPPPPPLPPRSSSAVSSDSVAVVVARTPPPPPPSRSAGLPPFPAVHNSRGPPLPPPVIKGTVSCNPMSPLSGVTGPPTPPPPPAVRTKNAADPAPPPLKPSFPPQMLPGTGKSNTNKANVKPKLKPLHWDKVKADPSRSMVWDKLRTGSFELNEEVIENLFGYNSTAPSKDSGKPSRSAVATKKPGILDAKKAHNIAIQLRALNLRKEEVCDALLEGNGLSCELLEVLVKMAPTQEEQKRLQAFSGDPSELGPAERFLKAILEVPYAFERLKAMLFKTCFKDDLLHAQECLQTLEVACTEVRNSRLFLKLLEAVLKMGNRMNAGTFRGEADAFKLDALLRLSDIKSADGRMTLLHFVVEEIIKAEGIRAVRMRTETNIPAEVQKSDDDYKSIGLQVVSSLSSELGSVRKAAGIDAGVLSQSISKLVSGLGYIKEMFQTQFQSQIGNLSYPAAEDHFFQHMTLFVKQAGEDVNNIQNEFSRVLDKVKQVTAYFHGNLKEPEPLRLFMIVSEFCRMLERACADVAKTLKLNPCS